MHAVRRPFIGTLAVALAAALAGPPAARGFSGGITSNNFGMTGCPLCHGGGSVPTVTLSGPAAVAPSSTNEYTLTIASIAAQNFGGLNVSALDGTFTVGGGSSANTQTLVNPMSGRAEITHTGPKMGDGSNTITFSLLWTAPASFTSVTLNGWGNAVNLNGSTSGDFANFDSLEVLSTAATPTPTSTPTATPTATPTPSPAACGSDAEPLAPALVADPLQQDCQETIAKAGFVYMKKDLKAVQKCLKAFHKGQLSGDPVALCVGSATTAPADATTAGKLALAEAKASASLDLKCTDASVAPLDTCADTVAGVKTCLIDTHRQRIVDAIDAQYGALVASTDAAVRKCQTAIGGAARKFLTTYLRAAQKCLNKGNQQGLTDDAAVRCIGSVAGGVFVPPTEPKTALKLAKAEDKLRAKIAGTCTDAQVLALDACGDTATGAADCIVCSHHNGTWLALGDEYGGS